MPILLINVLLLTHWFHHTVPIQVYFTKVIIHLSPRDIVGLILSVEATFIASQCLHMTSTWNTSQFPVYSPLFLQTKPNAWQMSLPEQCHSQCKARAFCLMCTLFFFCMQAEASGLKTSHVWCASCAALSGEHWESGVTSPWTGSLVANVCISKECSVFVKMYLDM